VLLLTYIPAAVLQGTLPASWGALGNLTQLHLYNSTLSGTLPASWSGMAKVTTLSLHLNQLSGVKHAS
jgi:hypothetical protein